MRLFWQCLAAVLAGVACAGALVLVFPPKARGAEVAEPEAEWIRHVLLAMELAGEPAYIELVVRGDARHATLEACVKDAARFHQVPTESALPVKVFCERRRRGATRGDLQMEVQ